MKGGPMELDCTSNPLAGETSKDIGTLPVGLYLEPHWVQQCS